MRGISKTFPTKRLLLQRFLLAVMLLAAITLMVMDKFQPQLFESSRSRALDIVAPILEVFHNPIQAVHSLYARFDNIWNLQAENARLRLENRQLMQWQAKAMHLDDENRNLRQILLVPESQSVRFVTARVIADPGGAFVRTLAVNAGKRDNVKKGQAVMVAEGLMGQITNVGWRSSRFLLLTDLNSRLPVTIAGTTTQAVLVGDNSQYPHLLYLKNLQDLKIGQEILTSGLGGKFPAGLPVGYIAEIGTNSVRVALHAKAYKQKFVRLTDFGLESVFQGLETAKTLELQNLQ